MSEGSTQVGFLNSRKDTRKDVMTDFFVRCRRIYVRNKFITIILFYILFTHVENFTLKLEHPVGMAKCLD